MDVFVKIGEAAHLFRHKAFALYIEKCADQALVRHFVRANLTFDHVPARNTRIGHVDP